MQPNIFTFLQQNNIHNKWDKVINSFISIQVKFCHNEITSGQVFLPTELQKKCFSFHKIFDLCIIDKRLWTYIITLIPLIANENILEATFQIKKTFLL